MESLIITPIAAATAWSADGTPEFGSCDEARLQERLCHTPAPVVAQLAAGAAVSLDNKGTSRCRYINSLLDGMTIKPPM